MRTHVLPQSPRFFSLDNSKKPFRRPPKISSSESTLHRTSNTLNQALLVRASVTLPQTLVSQAPSFPQYSYRNLSQRNQEKHLLTWNKTRQRLSRRKDRGSWDQRSASGCYFRGFVIAKYCPVRRVMTVFFSGPISANERSDNPYLIISGARSFRDAGINRPIPACPVNRNN